MPGVSSAISSATACRPPRPPKPAAPVFDEGQRPALMAPDNMTFPVSGFRITHNTVFAEDELQALLQGFVGKELSLADL